MTLGRLAAVEAAEAALRALGFGQLRVRHHGDAARLEVETDALAACWPAGTRSCGPSARRGSASSPSTWKASAPAA